MLPHEAEIERLEEEFPTLSEVAFASARQQVLAAGRSVLEAEDGVIYRVFANGQREIVKHIEPPLDAAPGHIYYL